MNIGERFWAKVDKTGGASACWPWTGKPIVGTGYGRVRVGEGRSARAHRVAYMLACGPIPDGLDVLHRCDNRTCCNPEHLFTGTNGDNNRDRASKGRSATGKRSGRHTHPERYENTRGEQHHLAVLNDTAVQEIRAAGPDANQSLLARRYGVSRTTIRNVLRGVTWKAGVPSPA